MEANYIRFARFGQMTPEIVFMGHVVNEMIRFPDRTVGPVLGGPAAYGSVVAARLGTSVGIVTRIGADMTEDLLEPLKLASVDKQGVRREGQYTTSTELVYSESGDKEIHYPHKAAPLLYEDIPASYLQAQCIHVCPMDWDVPLATITRLRALNMLLSVDLGGYGGAHSRVHPNEAEQRNPGALTRLVSQFDVVRASVEDCRYLFGTVEGRLEEIVSLFVQWGAQIGIISVGAQGVLLATPRQRLRVPALPGSVVDTTGAGDAFSSGFLVEYLRTRDPVRAAWVGSAVSKCVIEGTGGVVVQRMPTRADIDKRLADMGVMTP